MTCRRVLLAVTLGLLTTFATGLILVGTLGLLADRELQPSQDAPRLLVSKPAEQIARSYIAERRKSHRHFLPHAHEIRARFTIDSNEEDAALRGFSALLTDESPETRRDAVSFLGALGDAAALRAITGVLKDADAFVRRSACDALAQFNLSTEATSELRRLIQDDPSVHVRVSAARTLRADDEAAVAAYRQGLEVFELRELCEDTLLRIGKLELPLPEHMYSQTSYAQYDDWRKQHRIKRAHAKNGKIFFEVGELIGVGGPGFHAMTVKRFWYWIDDPKAEPTRNELER